MSKLPSEHSNPFIESAEKQVYLTAFNAEVEQSAIYQDVDFPCMGEPSFGIVITSQCDIERSSDNNYVLVARLSPVAEIFTYILSVKNGFSDEVIFGKEPIPADKPKRKSVVNSFISNYLKNQTVNYYYLPALDSILPNSFVCCEISACTPIGQLKSKKKLCVLRSPFREAVPTFFSAYVGRIGTASYHEESLQKVVDSFCKLRDT